MTSRYDLSDNLKEMVDKAAAQTGDRDATLKAIQCLDLTDLRDDTTPTDIDDLCQTVLAADYKPAAVCVHPRFVERVDGHLHGIPVYVATVINFPDGQDDPDDIHHQTQDMINAGANEVDIVLNYHQFPDGDKNLAIEQLRACRIACGQSNVMKVILETGVLEAPDIIRQASEFAIEQGADFIKTSTGKASTGARLAAGAVMLDVIHQHGTGQNDDHPVGIKFSGGIKTPDQVAEYIMLTRQIAGPGWLNPARLRFGASSLYDRLIETL
jgi:deoxyribose-phosphate aldolase